MRRKDREVADFSAMLEIVKACDCCRIGLVDGEEAYIVPMNFGYEAQGETLTLYFHCAREGRKLDLIPLQKRTAFEMDAGHGLIEGMSACEYSFHYQCVMGKGILEVLEEPEEKLHGLERIMEHYAHTTDWNLKPGTEKSVCVLRLKVEEWSCKRV